MNLLEFLLDISALAAEGRLDAFLDEHDVPKFEDNVTLPAPPRKFGSRSAFDRSTFDYEAYSSEIERHLKK